MSTPADAHEDLSLLNADRELTASERKRLESLSKNGWLQVMALLAQRSKATYSVAGSQTFTRCVQMHLDDQDRDEMMDSDLYNCPVCETLLKDRGSPVASSILMERGRLRELWLDVEQAPHAEFDMRLDRFRSALGLVR